MIHLDHVTVTFPDGDSRITAVNDVSLRGEPGTVTGIIGPSGSGKSSLLAVASTLVSPDSGHVWIDDVDAAQLSAKEAAVLRRCCLQRFDEENRSNILAVAPRFLP